MVRRCAIFVTGILSLSVSEAHAQAVDVLFEILCGPIPGCETAFGDSDAKESLFSNLRDQTSTFPIASSAGGFTWTFDRSLGIQTRKSASFGPIFAERPLTNGSKKLN